MHHHHHHKILLVIGQDLNSVGEYAKGYAPEPAGVTTYTDIATLDGLCNDADWGAGLINAKKYLEEFPNSALVIGLYMVNMVDGVSSGEYDRQIETLAEFIKEANRPVYLRIGYEFDGDWNSYNPEKYRVAFRYIHEKLRNLAGENKSFVWQSASRNYQKPDLSLWYPGDDYVDWVGLSYFAPAEVLAFARLHNKPVMISEATPQRYDLLDGPSGKNRVKKTPEEIWNEWFKPFFEFMYENSDVIKGFAYINADWDSQPMWGPPNGYWGDSRVQVNPIIRNLWQKEIKKSIWIHGG
nr:beta-1,3-xylanase [synthetic construct]